MSAASITCESRVERVTVYARGAVVARRVSLPPELPSEAADLVVSGVTIFAEPGSVRAVASGDRGIVALRSALVVPPKTATNGSLKSRVRDLNIRKVFIHGQRAHLKARRDMLAATMLDPGLARAARRVDPSARVADAVALSALLSREVEALDKQIQEINEIIEREAREREAAELEASQARTAELEGEGRPSLDIILRVAPGAAGGMRALHIEYVTRAARWLPAYAARFSAAATRVEWSIEALVAQASGEDWDHIELALSTADLVTDARLPELASIRLGRAQPAARKGYRAAPEGLDKLFEGYDRFAATVPPAALPQRRSKSVEILPMRASTPGEEAEEAEEALESAPATRADLKTEASIEAQFFALGQRAKGAPSDYPSRMTLPSADEAPSTEIDLPYGAVAAPGGMPPPPLPAPAARMASAPAPMAAMAMPAPKARGGFSFGFGGGSAPQAAPARGGSYEMQEAGGGGGPTAWEAAEPSGIEPADAWLDFDILKLNDPADRGSRGRLVRAEASGGGASDIVAGQKSRSALVYGLTPPPNTKDPRDGRGYFDHRYDAEGRADIPSSGRFHRVSVATKTASCAPRFITVPREASEVYREVEIQNPFGAPLLGGPVEVFVDGALLTQSAISHVDQGGRVHLGLGVEDRIRVARNSRVEEGSAGLLGGSTAVEHVITIDLTSSLGRDVDVIVLDRAPVTDDKDIEIKILPGKPQAEAYTQADRGQPIRRGLRWQVPLPAGGKARIEHGYRITLPSKNEIVGGNRREG